MENMQPRCAVTEKDQGMLSGGERRAYLSALDRGVAADPGLACGIVIHRGTPILNVVQVGAARRMVEVGCDHRDGRWRYVWADSGEVIAPVGDVAGAVRVLARELAAGRGCR
ncbi:hypothetical protein [Actinomadura kijaniata]|uniref:hypothetical protein n=1 Tax=Actinomadura kijaniata TaxID=46161 RepID=UPI000A953C7C|nr:hypothetical protein [Actinomadura kijaniata]